MIILKYGNTNTYYLKGEPGGLLIDTDYAGTLPGFYRAIKHAGITMSDISHVIATHYHPDHMGIIGDLQEHGVKLIIVDAQMDSIHFSDAIFARERYLRYKPIDENRADIINCEESRTLLGSIGISGEIIRTSSHSSDSISIILDNGDCFVGDLEPVDYLEAYDNNPALQKDWDELMKHGPKHIYYAHVNEKKLDNDGC